jgi:hypothetical protein
MVYTHRVIGFVELDANRKGVEHVTALEQRRGRSHLRITETTILAWFEIKLWH